MTEPTTACRRNRHRLCGGYRCTCACHGENHDPEPEISWASFLNTLVGDCIDHPHEQAGRCVYCKPCGRRLYQGTSWTDEERDAAREVMGRVKP